MENFQCSYGTAAGPAYQQPATYQHQQAPPQHYNNYAAASHSSQGFNHASLAGSGYPQQHHAASGRQHCHTAAPAKRGVRWGQNEYREYTDYEYAEDEASPTEAHGGRSSSMFSLAFGGGMPEVGAFAPGGGFGGFGGSNAGTAAAFHGGIFGAGAAQHVDPAPFADTREACAPISASKLVQRRWKANVLGSAR